MNRTQRKFGRGLSKNNGVEDKNKVKKVKNDEIEKVLSPRFKGNPFKYDKSVANRCCHIKPTQKDEEQWVDTNVLDNNLNDLIRQQYDFDPLIPVTIKQLKDLQKVFCEGKPKAEKCSQYMDPLKRSSYAEISEGSHWQNVENADDLERLLKAEKEVFDTNNVYISEVPHIKVIAEKFSKFTRNNVELRKLDEKIVCIEYDIFKMEENVFTENVSAIPIQKMRAYFSVKPTSGTDGEKPVSILPLTIKHEFNITDKDLNNLNEKEIEIIDCKIAENKPYLDDLKKVLKRKQAIYAKKKKSSLDLKSLYEMAKREGPSLDEDFSDTNLLSKGELEEIKALITKKCASSIHGINRHTVKYDKDVDPKDEMNIISESILAELIRN